MQGEEIASSKADGLRAHYGATDDACAFWDVHSALEESHAQWTNEALRDLDGDALAGFTTVATAWWQWLDEREAEGLALAA
jgi:pyrroloquinoline quinone (PQQ) biosynthesis protein C